MAPRARPCEVGGFGRLRAAKVDWLSFAGQIIETGALNYRLAHESAALSESTGRFPHRADSCLAS